MLALIAFVESHIAGFDMQTTAVRHCIPAVDREIHDDLLNLARIGAHETEIRREPGDQFDVFSDKATEQGFGIPHDRVDVDYSRLNHLPPAERKELLR